MWSLGLTYFTECPDKKTLAKKVLTHPCILAVFFGFVLLITQVQLPGVVNQTIKTLANANTATCMILIGSILAGVPFKSLAVLFLCPSDPDAASDLGRLPPGRD